MTPEKTRILVIGQGYVGLPLSCALSGAGFQVTGFDLNSERVALVNRGESGLDDEVTRELAHAIAAGYSATDKLPSGQQFDVVVVCVPTPLGNHGEVDLSAVMAAARDGASVLRDGGLFILESTSFPGTTDEYVRPVLEAQRGVLDEGFFLAFSPERIDPGNEKYSISNTPRIVGGSSPRSAEVAADLYRHIVPDVTVVKGAKEAEMAKLLENTYRQVNIALANELARVCHELNIDYWDVVRGASTKPYGFQPFYPGPGVGGHCIPIDPIYLNERVRDVLGRPLEFVELAQQVNDAMPTYVAERVLELLTRDGLDHRKAKVLLLGATYKANVADRRGAPIDQVVGPLTDAGCHVEYHDPLCASIQVADGQRMHSVADLGAASAQADVVVVLQAHREYVEPGVLANAQRVFDTRGVLTGANVSRL